MITNEFTPEKSLQLISDVIEKSRRDFEKNSGTPMILWGGIVLAVSVVIWLLLYRTGNGAWNYLWFVIPVAGWPVSYFLIGRKEEKRAKNFLNEAIGQVWLLFGAVSTLLAVLVCFVFPDLRPLLTLMIILILGFSTALTGMLLKNHVITAAGAVVAVAGSILAVLLPPLSWPLLLGGSSFAALVLPGIMLNLKRK